MTRALLLTALLAVGCGAPSETARVRFETPASELEDEVWRALDLWQRETNLPVAPMTVRLSNLDDPEKAAGFCRDFEVTILADRIAKPEHARKIVLHEISHAALSCSDADHTPDICSVLALEFLDCGEVESIDAATLAKLGLFAR